MLSEQSGHVGELVRMASELNVAYQRIADLEQVSSGPVPSVGLPLPPADRLVGYKLVGCVGGCGTSTVTHFFGSRGIGVSEVPVSSVGRNASGHVFVTSFDIRGRNAVDQILLGLDPFALQQTVVVASAVTHRKASHEDRAWVQAVSAVCGLVVLPHVRSWTCGDSQISPPTKKWVDAAEQVINYLEEK